MNRSIKYRGLRERPNYEDKVNYLAIDKPKTSYPFDRTAAILRNSTYLTQLDGEKDKLRDILLREQSRSTGASLASSRATASVGRGTPPIHASAVDERVEAEMDEPDEMLDAHRAVQDDRRAAMRELGAQAVEGLHGPRDAAAVALAAARGTLGGLYSRMMGEAGAADPPIEGRTPRHHARGRGSNE
jgi:hypothetical protein